MIQRIQSVFLLVAGLLHVLLFKVSFYTAQFYTAQLESSTVRYTAWQHENITTHEIHTNLIHIIIQFALLGFTLFTIFSYKNRKEQMKFCWYLFLGTVLSFLFPVYAIFTANYSEYHFGFGAYVLGIAAILYICAYFFIKKDEDLVRSIDRLR